MDAYQIRRQRAGKFVLALTLSAAPLAASATTVAMQTSLGEIRIRLYDSQAPVTVANFLNYVRSGAYNGTFIHRSVPGFIIQGGGYSYNGAAAVPVATNPPIVNEFSPTRSNVRGTIAMAKLGNNPNSATSQWFFNLADNSSNLNNQNGGFTVFGEVIANGMTVVDGIAALPKFNATSVLPLSTGASNTGIFTNLPLINSQFLVVVNSATVVPEPVSVPLSAASLWLLGPMLAGIAGLAKRRQPILGSAVKAIGNLHTH